MSKIKIKNIMIITLGVVLLFALGFSILHIKGAQNKEAIFYYTNKTEETHITNQIENTEETELVTSIMSTTTGTQDTQVSAQTEINNINNSSYTVYENLYLRINKYNNWKGNLIIFENEEEFLKIESIQCGNRAYAVVKIDKNIFSKDKSYKYVLLSNENNYNIKNATKVKIEESDFVLDKTQPTKNQIIQTNEETNKQELNGLHIKEKSKLTFSFKDDGVGVKRIEVSKDDSPLISYDLDNGEYKTTENGVYKITAIDYLDNKCEEIVEINDIFSVDNFYNNDFKAVDLDDNDENYFKQVNFSFNVKGVINKQQIIDTVNNNIQSKLNGDIRQDTKTELVGETLHFTIKFKIINEVQTKVDFDLKFGDILVGNINLNIDNTQMDIVFDNRINDTQNAIRLNEKSIVFYVGVKNTSPANVNMSLNIINEEVKDSFTMSYNLIDENEINNMYEYFDEKLLKSNLNMKFYKVFIALSPFENDLALNASIGVNINDSSKWFKKQIASLESEKFILTDSSYEYSFDYSLENKSWNKDSSEYLLNVETKNNDFVFSLNKEENNFIDFNYPKENIGVCYNEIIERGMTSYNFKLANQKENTIFDGKLKTELIVAIRPNLEETNPKVDFYHTGNFLDVEDIKLDSQKPWITKEPVFSVKRKDSTQYAENINSVKIGDTIKTTFSLSDGEGSGLSKEISLEYGVKGTEEKFTVSNVTNVENGIYEAEFTINEDIEIFDFLKENDLLKLELKSIKFSDNVKNETVVNYTDKKIATFYLPIEITDLNFSSTNLANKDELVKDGDDVIITFRTNHDTSLSSVSINGKKIEGEKTSIYRSNSVNWTIKTTVQNGDMSDLSNVGFEFTLNDIAENTPVKKTEKDVGNQIQYFAPIEVTELKLISTNSADTSKLVKDGEQVIITFRTNHDTSLSFVSINGNEIVGKKTSVTDSNSINWRIETTVKNGDMIDLSNVKFEFTVNDIAENTPVKKTQDNVTNQLQYYEPIEVTELKLISTNSANKDELVKDGDDVIITFRTNHDTSFSFVSINGNEIVGKKTSVNNSNSVNWSIKTTVKNGDMIDLSNVKFEFTVNDIAENTPVKKTQDNVTNQLQYYEPIEVTNLKLISTNSADTSKLLKDEDQVIITFKTNHDTNLSSVSVNGKKVEGEKTGSNNSDSVNWHIETTVKNGEMKDLSNVTFEFTVNDIAENEPVKKTEQDVNNQLQYFAPLEITDLKLESSNDANKNIYVKNEELVTISFKTNHDTQLSSVKINGKTAETAKFNISDSDKKEWNITKTIKDGDMLDLADITFEFTVNDIAENNPLDRTQNDVQNVIKYYAPIKVIDLALSSTNSEDTTKYLKNGDNAMIKFRTNHDTELINVNINGKPANIVKQDVANSAEKSWEISTTINNGDMPDLTDITFEFTATDVARNTPVNNSQLNVQNALKYYAPLTVTTLISSNQKNSSYVTNGGQINLTSRVNHQATVTSASILNMIAGISSNNSENLAMMIKIGENETKLKEGLVPFTYSIRDVAGNNLDNINTSSQQVHYDYTKPEVTVTPRFSGFTNKEVEYTITYSDLNLNPNAISLKINDEEFITSEDRRSLKGTTFTKIVKLDVSNEDEKSYVIIPDILDLAENNAKSITKTEIIIDKLSPKINILNSEIFAEPDGAKRLKTKVFNQEINILDYFNLDENNISEIICTLTDEKGVTEWDINKPIFGDGKKTIYLQVIDKANNKSPEMVCEFMLDTTAPRSIVKEMLSNTMVKSMELKSFIQEMNLAIKLEEIEVVEGERDYFTMATLTKPNGEIIDLLNGIQTGNLEDLIIKSSKDFMDGKYVLSLNAKDNIGNEMGQTDYNFEFKDKTLLAKYVDNKPLFISTITLFIIGLISSVGYLIYKKKRV